MANELELQRLAARQHGLASREQLLRIGFTARQIAGRVQLGQWHRVAPCTFDVVPGSVDPRRALHAAVLASGGLASHGSAAHLLGLIDDPPRHPELVVAEGRLPEGVGATVHRTRTLERRDRTTVDNIPCTSVQRTLLDLGARVPPEILETAVARAITSRRTTARRLQQMMEDPHFGRPGAGALRQVLATYTDRSGTAEGLLEVLVERAVRTGRLPAPVRQHWVRAGGRRYRLDLAWPEQRVVVEADGYSYHASPAQLARDRVRQNALVVVGWLPLRYTWAAARADGPGIMRQVAAVLAGRSAAR